MQKLNRLYETALNEADWENTWKDADATCMSAENLSDGLNQALKVIKSKGKIKKDVRAPILGNSTSIETFLIKVGSESVMDVEQFKNWISEPPNYIFKSIGNAKMQRSSGGGNVKMQKSGDVEQVTVNTGIPALSSVIYDTEHGQFYSINTCPGAGACQLHCYARKGSYVMFSNFIGLLIKRLNYMINDPEGYYNLAVRELEHIAKQNNKKGKKVFIRWNDAGDFFSEEYYNIAMKATKYLIDKGYNVRSYAYTKQEKFATIDSDDFVMNFSKGAKPTEMNKVDFDKTKYSDVVIELDVDEPIFSDLFQMGTSKKTGKPTKYDMNPDTGLPNFVKGGAEELKKRISKKYDISLERLLFQHELPYPEKAKFTYDVIVLPKGDSDIAAQRQDVHKTLLIVH